MFRHRAWCRGRVDLKCVPLSGLSASAGARMIAIASGGPPVRAESLAENETSTAPATPLPLVVVVPPDPIHDPESRGRPLSGPGPYQNRRVAGTMC